jgi:hypothetical protein
MTDDQLRAIIRDSVARHLASGGTARPGAWPALSAIPPASPASASAVALGVPAAQALAPTLPLASSVASAQGAVSIASAPGGIAVVAAPGSVVHLHVSHATFTLPGALDGSLDGPCRTEPHAGCTSCGFCQSLGY